MMQHCEKTVLSLIEELHVRVTKTTIQKDLLEHPDYPSLLSISDVLKTYGIDNIAIKLPIENFNNIAVPFIAYIKGLQLKHSLFAVVNKVNKESIQFYNPGTNKKEKLTKDEFAKLYEGIVLAVEANPDAEEKDYDKKRKNERQKDFYNLLIALPIPLIIVLSVSFAFVQHDVLTAIYPVLFTIITFIGCIVGVLLLWHQVDEYNPVINEICHAGKKINCSAILNSKAASIFGISWSVLGSTYFMGMLLSLLAGGITNTNNLFLLSWINVIALPYIIYSISYQWLVAKQWCILCLTVQAILFIQFIVAFTGKFHRLHSFSQIPYLSYIIIFTCFSLVFTALLLLMPALEKAKDSRGKTIALQRLKHNPQIFEALLARQKFIDNTADDLGIIIGNPSVKYRLTKVCNPYCGPCARAHPIMEDLLKYNDNLQLQIIFTATDKEDDIRTKPAKHLLAIASLGDEQLTEKALDDWYGAPIKDYEAFAAKYPLKGELARQTENIKKMSNWCEKTEIAFTPTFFINGYQLPVIYSVNDLKYFLSN